MRLFEALKRQRIARGFTVHSPFAYRFITRVLREKCAYYHFRHEVTEPTEQVLYRVAVYFRPEQACCLGAEAKRAAEVVSLALPNCSHVTPDRAQFVVLTSGAEVPAQLPETTMALSLDHLPHLHTRPGMLFHSRRWAVLVSRKGLPTQSFPLP